MNAFKSILACFYLLFCINSEVNAQVFNKLPDSLSNLPIILYDYDNFDQFEWLDYDNDNDYDFILSGKNVANNQYQAILYENLNGLKFIIKDTFHFASSVVLLSIGDLDNDNALDLIFSLYNEEINIYKNNLPFTKGFTALNDTCSDYYFNLGRSAAFGNFLNDGKDAVCQTKVSGINSKIIFYKNKYSSDCGFTCVDSIGNSFCNFPKFVDFNNDGFMDFINFTIATTGNYFKNNGIGSQPRFSRIIQNYYNSFNVNLNISDFNNDGLLDLTVSGISPKSNNIYLNQGNHSFFKKINNGISDTIGEAMYPMDFNNDGKMDIITTRKLSYAQYSLSKYKNLNDTSFVFAGDMNISGTMKEAKAADYDNDGDLDIFMSGLLNSQPGYFSAIYRNDSTLPNTLPNAPNGLFSEIDSNKIILRWNRATDIETPQATLSYNIMAGTSSKGIDITSPKADTVTGFPRVVGLGNAQLNNFYILDKSKFSIGDTIFWSVQTIDNGYGYSPFSQEHSFIVCNSLKAPEKDTICSNDSLYWHGGYYMNPGKHYKSYSSSSLCDSSFVLELSLKPSFLNSFTLDKCGGVYNWYGQNYFQSGTYNKYFSTVQGCDSIEKLVLNLRFDYTTFLSESKCVGDSVLFGNTNLKSSGIYFDTLQTIYGCDSILKMDLKFSPEDTAIFMSGDTLFTSPQNALFRWYDCDLQTYIYAANKYYFVPYKNGKYAVEISANGCSYMSRCVEVTGLSIGSSNHNMQNFVISPNPNSGHFTITNSEPFDKYFKISIFNCLGQKVGYESFKISDNQVDIKLNEAAGGIYIIQIESSTGLIWNRFMVERN